MNIEIKYWLPVVSKGNDWLQGSWGNVIGDWNVLYTNWDGDCMVVYVCQKSELYA